LFADAVDPAGGGLREGEAHDSSTYRLYLFSLEAFYDFLLDNNFWLSSQPSFKLS